MLIMSLIREKPEISVSQVDYLSLEKNDIVVDIEKNGSIMLSLENAINLSNKLNAIFANTTLKEVG